MSSSSVALTKNLYLSLSLPECRNCREESCDITTMGLSTSMLKWSVTRVSASRDEPISLPHWFRILNGAAPVALMVRSTMITLPYRSGSSASCPTLRMLTSTFACVEPSRMKPFIPRSLRSLAAFFMPRHTDNAVSTADFPEPFSPTMKLIRGPRSTSRFLWHMKLLTFTFMIVPLPYGMSVPGSGALRFFSTCPCRSLNRLGRKRGTRPRARTRGVRRPTARDATSDRARSRSRGGRVKHGVCCAPRAHPSEATVGCHDRGADLRRVTAI